MQPSSLGAAAAGAGLAAGFSCDLDFGVGLYKVRAGMGLAAGWGFLVTAAELVSLRNATANAINKSAANTAIHRCAKTNFPHTRTGAKNRKRWGISSIDEDRLSVAQLSLRLCA